MTLFKTQTAQEIWIDHHCHGCFQPDEAARRLQNKDTQCPIQAKALNSDRKPVEWTRNQRASRMQDAYKCKAFQARPNRTGQKTQHFVDVPLFDVTPYAVEVGYVPVEGWPERPKGKEVEHQ